MLGIYITAQHITATHYIFYSEHNSNHGHTILEIKAYYASCFKLLGNLLPCYTYNGR